MDQEKRCRSANFTMDEKVLCLTIIKKYSHIIECKKTDSYTWRDKESIWKKIETEFNAESPAMIFRSKEVLRNFFDNKKKETRRLAAGINKTGGGPSDAKFDDPIYDLIFAIINKKSVLGLTNRYDGDETITVAREMFETSSGMHNDPNNTEEIIIISNEDETEQIGYNETDLEENLNMGDYESFQHTAKYSPVLPSTSQKKSNSEKIKEPLDWGNYKINHLRHPVHPNLRTTFQNTNKENQNHTTPQKRQNESPDTDWKVRRRPRLSNTTSLARQYEDLFILFDTKKDIAQLQLEILKAEKDKSILQKQREEEYNLKRERDEELFKLNRESLSLEIKIKRRQLENLNDF